MSSLPFPEDLSRWPRSPFELLGVAPGCAPRDLRRAYTNLIRTYKPEQYPEEFRRIREAYEAVLRLGELFGRAQTETGAAEPVPSPSAGQPFSRPAVREGSDELWEMALSGQEMVAYGRLAEWARSAPGRTDLAQRLYWLLSLNPELDPGRSPCDWLADGLRANGFSGPLAELYRRELKDDPAEAKSVRCGRLLECTATPERLAVLAVWRGQALIELGAWDLLTADFDTLCERLARTDERAWLRLLFALADELAWEEGPAAKHLRQRCHAEIRRHEHLAGEFAGLFDRLDFLVELSAAWRAIQADGSLPPDLVRLIARSWVRPFPEVRPLLEQVLGRLSEAPGEWLGHFDRLQARAPQVLAQFGKALDQLQTWLEWQPASREYDETLEDQALALFDGMNGAAHPADRRRFLHYCLRASLAPEQLAGFVLDCAAFWPDYAVAFCRAAMHDWPLRYLWRASQLFWA